MGVRLAENQRPGQALFSGKSSFYATIYESTSCTIYIPEQCRFFPPLGGKAEGWKTERTTGAGRRSELPKRRGVQRLTSRTAALPVLKRVEAPDHRGSVRSVPSVPSVGSVPSEVSGARNHAGFGLNLTDSLTGERNRTRDRLRAAPAAHSFRAASGQLPLLSVVSGKEGGRAGEAVVSE